MLWRAPLPGEAITGIAAAEDWVALTVVDGGSERSRVMVLSAIDGTIRWSRATDERFGRPAIAGRSVAVSMGDQVVALAVRNGRELAWVDLPADASASGETAFESARVQGSAVLAAAGPRWVDVRSGVHASIAKGHEIRVEGVGLVPVIEGLDPGFDDSERLRVWVDAARSDAPPRDAILLCRRAVVAMRLSPEGAPSQARWSHVARHGREFVAMSVTRQRVTLVAEDGAIRTLDRTGEVLDTIRGTSHVRGALLLDLDDSVGEPRIGRLEPKVVRRMLVDLLEDADPRLLPAQRVAATLLWRSEQVVARQQVVDLAEGRLRTDATAPPRACGDTLWS